MSTPPQKQTIAYTPIGFIRSPFRQKFAIPRQANLVPEIQGELVLTKEFSDTNALRELQQFSHVWVLFHFHGTQEQGWTPTVQPPRLGGKTRVGVFASRSPFRPNPIGMSVVRNLGYEKIENSVVIRLGGIDLLDGTPVLDLKPYLPWADSLPQAEAGFAATRPEENENICFSEAAEQAASRLDEHYPGLRELIMAVLRQDPRPAWRVRPVDDKQYGMSLYDLNIKWTVRGKTVSVLSIERIAG